MALSLWRFRAGATGKFYFGVGEKLAAAEETKVLALLSPLLLDDMARKSDTESALCVSNTFFLADKFMANYFTDLEFPHLERSIEQIDERVWSAIVSLIHSRMADHSFGFRFPEVCNDGAGPCGCDVSNFANMLNGEIPGIEWPLRTHRPPETPMILDVLEFCAASVGTPINDSWHSYFNHYHLSWDRQLGLKELVSDVNRLLRRNGLAFEMDEEGKIRRVVPEPMRIVLESGRFSTGDNLCDGFLEAARDRILLPEPEERREALDKLWDAFERLKTLEPGDKKVAANALLERTAVSGTRYRNFLDAEAKALTEIGNSLGIRHSETEQEHISGTENIDYLFTRMFAFLHLVAKNSGRAT
jgi:hypothetical protein